MPRLALVVAPDGNLVLLGTALDKLAEAAAGSVFLASAHQVLHFIGAVATAPEHLGGVVAFCARLVPPETPLFAAVALFPRAGPSPVALRLDAEDRHCLEVLGAVLIAEGSDSGPALLALRVAHRHLLLFVILAVVKTVPLAAEVGLFVARERFERFGACGWGARSLRSTSWGSRSHRATSWGSRSHRARRHRRLRFRGGHRSSSHHRCEIHGPEVSWHVGGLIVVILVAGVMPVEEIPVLLGHSFDVKAVVGRVDVRKFVTLVQAVVEVTVLPVLVVDMLLVGVEVVLRLRQSPR